MIKRWYYSASHWRLGDVMMANITFISFLLFSMCHYIHVAVNTWLNCSFFYINREYLRDATSSNGKLFYRSFNRGLTSVAWDWDEPGAAARSTSQQCGCRSGNMFSISGKSVYNARSIQAPQAAAKRCSLKCLGRVCCWRCGRLAEVGTCCDLQLTSTFSSSYIFRPGNGSPSATNVVLVVVDLLLVLRLFHFTTNHRQTLHTHCWQCSPESHCVGFSSYM